jgi:hypothetical protein
MRLRPTADELLEERTADLTGGPGDADGAQEPPALSR